MAKKKTATNGNGASTATFEAGVEKLQALATEMITVMDTMGLASLTADERAHSIGRMRIEEPAAIETVLDTMDKFPGVFASLADKDGGTDAEVVETAPARASLARAQGLAPVVKSVGTILSRLSDDTLASGAAAKEVSLPAYAIAKANAANNVKLRTELATAIDFYAGPARKTSLKNLRAGNAAKKAAKGAAKS